MEKEKKIIPFKKRREANYLKKALERDVTLFKWKSDVIKLPFNPEFWLTTHGSLGYLLPKDGQEGRWVCGAWDGVLDEYGDFTNYVYWSLDTNKVKTGSALNHKEIIVCGNTPLYRPFDDERAFYAEMKAEADTSLIAQLILSRLSKAFKVTNDQQAKEVKRAYEDVVAGLPLIIKTGIMDGLEELDLTDNRDVDKLQYISSFYQTLEKREANDFGVDLDLIDKRAQVSNKEITQYDDVTTLEYLTMFEMRQRFVDEMKENGFDLEIVRNPVFYDEPEEKDVEEGTFEAAESEAEEVTPEEPEEKKEGVNNGSES
jgi:hypothetical protein